MLRAIAGPLIESLVHEVVCREHDIAEYVPAPPGGLIGYDSAVRLALATIRDATVETRWSGASLPDSPPSDPMPRDPEWSGGSIYSDLREQRCRATPERLWWVVEGIGGEHGWYSFRWRGRYVAGWTGSSAGWGCAVAAAIRTPTGGRSRRSMPSCSAEWRAIAPAPPSTPTIPGAIPGGRHR